MLSPLVWLAIIPLLSPAPQTGVLPLVSNNNTPALRIEIPQGTSKQSGATLSLAATLQGLHFSVIIPEAMDGSNLWLAIDRQQDQLPDTLKQANLPWLPHHHPWMLGCRSNPSLSQADPPASPPPTAPPNAYAELPATIIQGFDLHQAASPPPPLCRWGEKISLEGERFKTVELALSWKDLALAPGLDLNIALGLRIDRHEGPPWLWGARSAREWHRDTMVQYQLPPLPTSIPISQLDSPWIWPHQSQMALKIYNPHPQTVALRYQWDQQPWQTPIKLPKSNPEQPFVVPIPIPQTSQSTSPPSSLQIAWLNPNQHIVGQQQFQLQHAQISFERALRPLPKQQHRAPWWLKRHRSTVEAIAQQTWQQIVLRQVHQPKVAARELAELLDFLAQERNTQQEDYTGQPRRHLLFAGRSSVDGSLIPYTVVLPDNLLLSASPPTPSSTNQATMGLPILLMLHGRLQDDRWFAFAKHSQRMATLTDPSWWIVQPWARGNLYYQQSAEQDVLDTLDDLRLHHPLDEEHIYLAGFSMGGAGAWQLSLWRPHLFTAAAVLAGGSWLTPKGTHMACNTRHLPMVFAHGMADPIVDPLETSEMIQQLTACDLHPQVFWIPDLQHLFPMQVWPQIRAALAQHHGKAGQGKAFTYQVQDHLHARYRGIGLSRHMQPGNLPIVSAQLQGQHLLIKAKDQHNATIVMNQMGFDWPEQQPIYLYWNNELVYQGPPAVVTIGQGSGLR